MNGTAQTTTIEKHINTSAGHQISTILFSTNEPPKGVVIISSAMGVDQGFYSKLAGWLRSLGYAAITFDYFGSGRSLKGRIRDCTSSVMDWATQDCEAVIKYGRDQFPEVPIIWLGHSLGGQIFGMIPNSSEITKVIGVASGNGYWRYNAPQLKNRVWFLWFFLGPLATYLFGYFPGKRFNMVGDLPKNVIRQWRSWCLNRNYSIGVEGKELAEQFKKIRCPFTSISFSDDEMLSLQSFETLLETYENAKKKLIRISPADIDEPRIGHFGFFKEKFREKLWEKYLAPELQI